MSTNFKSKESTIDIFNSIVLPEKNITTKNSVTANVNNSNDFIRFYSTHCGVDLTSKEYKKAARKFKLHELKITLKRIIRGIPASIPLFIVPLIGILLLYFILRKFFPFIENISLSNIIIVTFILHNIYLEIDYRRSRTK